MAPVYKLTYFDFMGIGEPIRYMLSYGGVNYENVMVNRKTNWPTIKPTVPFGHLPVLEVDGKVLFQSLAICRYLAKKFNLLTGDDWTNAQIDAMADTIYELSERLTWVDLWFVGIMEYIHGMWGVNLIEGKYSHLSQLVQKVYNLPAIKTYIGKRPHYDW